MPSEPPKICGPIKVTKGWNKRFQFIINSKDRSLAVKRRSKRNLCWLQNIRHSSSKQKKIKLGKRGWMEECCSQLLKSPATFHRKMMLVSRSVEVLLKFWPSRWKWTAVAIWFNRVTQIRLVIRQGNWTLSYSEAEQTHLSSYRALNSSLKTFWSLNRSVEGVSQRIVAATALII